MRSKRKKKIRVNVPRLALSLLILAAAVFLLIGGARALINKPGEDQIAFEPLAEEKRIEEPPEEAEFPKDESLVVKCVGDILPHGPILSSSYDKDKDSYDFRPLFKYTKDFLSDSDITLANMETSFSGKPPYIGYPSFNSPDSLADAVIDAGIDVACFANNHMLDSGGKALLRGVRAFREKGLLTAGARLSEDAPRYSLIKRKGVIFAVINYTYETPRNGGHRTIQSGIIKKELLPLINHFGYEDFESDMEGIKKDIESARADGANVVICYLHWGEEYQRKGNAWQEKIGNYLAENGADIVFGAHPHVPQNISFCERDGVKVPIFYSLGNFVSNQREETLGNRYTEEGMIAEVKLTYSFKEGRVVKSEFGCVPTWVDRYKTGGKLCYRVVPLIKGFEENDALKTSGHTARAKKAYEDMRELLGEEYIWEGESSRP